MIKRTLSSVSAFLAAAFLYATPVKAEKVCVAANFDGNYRKAESVLQVCEKRDADAIILMGDYSTRGIPGKVNFRTDFNSTKKVLEKFAKSRGPVYVLSGSNDDPQDVKKIAAKHSRIVPLEDNILTNIADLKVLPLNGYDNGRFMFEGASFVTSSDMNRYIGNLKNGENVTSVTHISPYGYTDEISSGKHVGDKNLEKVLDSKDISSINAAIREDPGGASISRFLSKKTRWKINPGMYSIMINTNGKGEIDSFYYIN